MSWRVYIESANFGRDYGVYIIGENQQGLTRIVRDFKYEEIKEGEYFRERGLTLKRELLQEIVDSCWGIGIKPTKESKEAEAQKAHLEDMRSLTFHKIGAEKP